MVYQCFSTLKSKLQDSKLFDSIRDPIIQSMYGLPFQNNFNCVNAWRLDKAVAHHHQLFKDLEKISCKKVGRNKLLACVEAQHLRASGMEFSLVARADGFVSVSPSAKVCNC